MQLRVAMGRSSPRQLLPLRPPRKLKAAVRIRGARSDRAPLLAAQAPASRIGDTISDADGTPFFQLVQLWACRKICCRCQYEHCQATFADRSATYHATHLCRDCKHQQGHQQAEQQVEQERQRDQASAPWPASRLAAVRQRMAPWLELRRPVIPLRAIPSKRCFGQWPRCAESAALGLHDRSLDTAFPLVKSQRLERQPWPGGSPFRAPA